MIGSIKTLRMVSTAILFVLSLFVPGIAGQVEGGAIVAIDEPAGFGAAARSGGGQSGKGAAKPSTTTRKVAGKTAGPSARTRSRVQPPPKKWDGFVVGDKYTFLNFEVISAAKPYHTRDAKANGAAGLVQVEILIGENGNVLTAKARTGNKLLHPEAERAALESKFNRPTVYGKPARAVGFLVYRFGPAED